MLTFALLAWCSCAFALNPALDVNHYAHAGWRIGDEFAEGPIEAIAQTFAFESAPGRGTAIRVVIPFR